jgi:hypothetical protein
MIITLKDFMELVNYRITEGSDYCWTCYGANAYTLSYWNQDHNGHSLAIIFDTHTHDVYEVQAHDYKHNRAYRLINPNYKDRYDVEAVDRGVEANQAWDDVDYVDLETNEDFLEKALAIIAGEDYDTRVSIPLNIPKDELLLIFTAAHERDMTFNEFVEEAIKEAIANFEQDPEEFKRRFNLPKIQSPPFPTDNFTRDQARAAVKSAKRKIKKKRG